MKNKHYSIVIQKLDGTSNGYWTDGSKLKMEYIKDSEREAFQKYNDTITDVKAKNNNDVYSVGCYEEDDKTPLHNTIISCGKEFDGNYNTWIFLTKLREKMN